MGLQKSEYKDTMRICNKHDMTTESETKTIERKSKKISFKCTFDVPSGKGMFYQSEHQPSSSSATNHIRKRDSTAFKRKIINEWEDRRVSLNEKYGESPAKIICGYEKLIQQMAESNSPQNRRLPLSQSLSSYFNIIKSPSPVKPNQAKYFKSTTNRKDKDVKSKPHYPSPTLLPFSVSDDEIKQRTGFQSEIAMLSFALITCNGNFDLLKQTNSILIWYEEWFLYFEINMGKDTHKND